MLRVLALDDSADVLQTLRGLFDVPGIALTTCEEVEAARALFLCGEYDALISDLAVSEFGGLEGLRLIEFATTHFPDTVVFGLTARSDAEVHRRGEQLGARGMFVKPDGVSDLRDAVLALIAEPDDTAATSTHIGLLETYLRDVVMHAHLQPIVRLVESPPFPVVAVESLARGPREEPLSNPALLFAYAAAKERLFDVDLRCIEAGLAEARELPTRVRLFLNVNPRSMSNPDFTARLEAAVAAVRRSPQTVIIELTEQQGILNTGAFAERLAELRFAGFTWRSTTSGRGTRTWRSCGT